MLDNMFSFEDSEGAYNLKLPICPHWQSSEKKILIVMQTVDRRDLKAGGIMLAKETNRLVRNCLKHTRQLVRSYDDDKTEAAWCAINFNNKKHLHLPSGPRRAAESEFAQRVHRAIKKLKPTHVLVSGDQAMNALFPNIEHSNYKRGWVHKLKVGEVKVKVTSTLDLSRLVENDGLRANLLGYWCRHLSHLMLGKHPHDLSHIKAIPKYLDTIEKVDAFFDNVMPKARIVATDTETANLSVLSNRLFTAQFATNLSPDIGYVIPVDHPMSPWTPEERKHVRSRLLAWLKLKPGDEGAPEQVVYFNGMYDLRIYRRAFKLPIIWHRVWEITAAEHLLDENIKELDNFGAKPGGLNAVLTSYGCDFYFGAKFSKGDRASMASVDPSSKEFLKYAAMDVVGPLHLRTEQIKRAAHQVIGKHNYKPYFIRHMLYQMSDTAHQLSHLREDGSLIDPRYLRNLISADSPLVIEAAKLTRQMKAHPAVVAANKKLMGDAGMKSKSLFSKAKGGKWVLSFSKPAHLRVLFFEFLGLKPLAQTETGENSVNKALIAEYRIKHPLVDDYGNLTQLQKLIGTYAKGWYKRLTSNSDSLADGHLRADYTFWDVATGRLASKNPNLQTIPSRSKLTKIIKRMFIAPPGCLLVRYDYSAHEVRVWSITSGDMDLANAFRTGQELRQQFIQNPSPELAADIKARGDIHVANVKRLFNKIIDKKHPLRDAVKAVVFGLLYGKSAKTLGEDTKTGEIQAIKARMIALYEELDAVEKRT